VRQLTVFNAPDEPVRLIRADGDAMKGSRWTLEALFPGRGFVAALAHRGARGALRTFEWCRVKDQ
jgi:hypothetical protein